MKKILLSLLFQELLSIALLFYFGIDMISACGLDVILVYIFILGKAIMNLID